MTPAPAHPPESESSSLGRRVLINAGALSGSSLWRIGVSFVLQLLIARILGVQALGIYTVALAYLNVGQVISEFGLPALLSRDLAPLPAQRRGWYRLALRTQFVAALVVWTGLIFLAFVLPYGVVARWSLILIGGSLPFYAITSATQTLFRAAERMELVMAVEVFINLLILAVSIVLLSIGTTVLQLIAVLIVTQAVSALTCLLIMQRARILAPPQQSIEAGLGELWLRTRPFFNLSIAEVLQQRIDILLLSIVAGPAITGIYSAAYNLVRILVKLIQSFWQALYPTLSRLHYDADSRYRTLSRLSLQAGLLILLPVAAIASGVSDELIRLVYTDEYISAGPVLRLLIWTTPLVFVSMYAVTQLMVGRQTTRGITIIAANLVAVAIVLPPLAARSGAIGAGWASLLAAAIGATTGLYLLRHNDVPFELQHVRWLAVATLAAGLLAGLLPVFWLVRALVAAVVYIAILMIGGTLNLSSARARYRALRLDDR